MKEEIFIGARELGNEIYKIMPTYTSLIDQLKEITQGAKSFENFDNSERREFNNTIGVFGARGTGKSSALYTIQKELTNNNCNILLPIIEPDNFGDNTKIIGSIVGFICNEGKHLICELQDKYQAKREILSHYYKNGVLKPNNPLQRLIYETIEYHLYTENHYRELLRANYEDLANHIKKSERLLLPDIEFKKKLNSLIQEIILVKTALNITDKDEDHEKIKIMLYIFIDDIDLKTNKTKELMHALLQYTNHPNIVTILSGDYQSLHQSLALSLLAEESLNTIGLVSSEPIPLLFQNQDNNGKNNMSILQNKTELAHQYLKKIIPPARRHQLVKWNENTIPNFAFGNTSLLNQFAELFNEDSPFEYKDEAGNSFPIKLGYSIFDERPRGIVNVYYHLNQILNSFKEAKDKGVDIEKQVIFRMIKSFIDTIISSNIRFSESQETIFKEFLSWGDDAESSFIDYSKTFDLDIELIIIGDLIRRFLNVKFSEDEFVKVKNSIVERLVTGIPDKKLALKERDRIMQEFKSSYKKFDGYYLIRGIGLVLDIKELFFLHELLLEFHDGNYYELESDYYNSFYKELNENKKKFILDTVNKLFNKNPKIIKKLVLQHKNNEESDSKKTILLLQNLCMQNGEYVKTQKIYENILNYIGYGKIPERLDFLAEINLKQDLFINTLTTIRQSDNKYFEEIGKLREPEISRKKSHFINLLKNIQTNSLIQKNEYEGTALRIFERALKNFSEYLNMRLFANRNFKVCIPNHFGIVNKFFNGQEGFTKKTLYDETRNKIAFYLNKNNNNEKYQKEKNYVDKNILFQKDHEVEFSDFYVINSLLNKLYSNTRVWYGQKEARDFISDLKNIAYIKFQYDEINEEKEFIFFRNDEQLALWHYYNYISGTKKFVDDIDYDNVKKSIKDKIDDEYEQLKNLTAAELRQYQLTLEYLEDDYSDGEIDV